LLCSWARSAIGQACGLWTVELLWSAMAGGQV